MIRTAVKSLIARKERERTAHCLFQGLRGLNIEIARKIVPLPLKGLTPLRLAHLSDFHAYDCLPHSYFEEVVDLTLRERPQVICLTGDFITRMLPEFEPMTHCLRRLARAAPTFAVLGNHDGGSWTKTDGGYDTSERVQELLRRSEVTLLHNRATQISIEGQTLQLVGVGDCMNRELDGEKAFADASGDLPTILLSHNPDTKHDVADFEWDLMLSGHAHGGQLRIPILNWRPLAPVRDRRYADGLKAWQGRLIHTTRGVGTVYHFRINCRPEISLLQLVPAQHPESI